MFKELKPKSIKEKNSTAIKLASDDRAKRLQDAWLAKNKPVKLPDVWDSCDKNVNENKVVDTYENKRLEIIKSKERLEYVLKERAAAKLLANTPSEKRSCKRCNSVFEAKVTSAVKNCGCCVNISGWKLGVVKVIGLDKYNEFKNIIEDARFEIMDLPYMNKHSEAKRIREFESLMLKLNTINVYFKGQSKELLNMIKKLEITITPLIKHVVEKEANEKRLYEATMAAREVDRKRREAEAEKERLFSEKVTSNKANVSASLKGRTISKERELELIANRQCIELKDGTYTILLGRIGYGGNLTAEQALYLATNLQVKEITMRVASEDRHFTSNRSVTICKIVKINCLISDALYYDDNGNVYPYVYLEAVVTVEKNMSGVLDLLNTKVLKIEIELDLKLLKISRINITNNII